MIDRQGPDSANRRNIPPPWSSATVRRILTVVASVAVVAAYCVIAVALNRPPGAQAPPPPADDAAGAGVGVTVTPSETTTTLPQLAVGKKGVTPPTTTTTIPVIQPGPLQAPRYGTYDIHVVTNDKEEAGTLYVGRDGSQRLTVGAAKRASRLRWTAKQGDLLRTGEAKGDGSCEWSPPAVMVASNLTEGRTWSSDVTCITSAGDATLIVRRQESAKVTRRVRTQVAGEQFDAWLIERHIITTSRGSGVTLVTEEAASELFAPKIGLAVYALRRTDVPRADGGVDSILEAIELKSAKPY